LRVVVRYSGFLAEIAGCSWEELELGEGAGLEELIKQACKKHPRLAEWLDKLPLLQVLVNGVEVDTAKQVFLKEGDVVVLAPPLYEGG
jgi:molybdopterin converting factor small subunit